MQSTAVQTKTRNTHNLRTETSQNVSGKKDNAEFADPFLQIIMNLLTQSFDQSTQQTNGTTGLTGLSGTDQSNNLAALLQNMPAGMTDLLNTLLNDGLNSETALNAKNNAGLMEALTSTTSSIPTDIPLSTGIGTDLLSSVSDQTSQLTNLSEILSRLSKGTSSTGTVAISSDAVTQLTDLLGLSSRDELQSALKNAGIEVVSSDSAQTQGGLSEAILKAKQMLSSNMSKQQDDSSDIDVDNLLNELSKNEVTTPFELRFKTMEDKGNVKLLEQLTDGIKQNIALGKSEFTIKLKPESLGEITIKLIEDAGKTTLSISTANAQTAKLINNDIQALKQAVAPMNVEVHNAVVSTNETANGSMQQFNMSGQQFAGQQFAGQQSFYQMSQNRTQQSDSQIPEDFYASSQAAQVRALSSERLDTYI